MREATLAMSADDNPPPINAALICAEVGLLSPPEFSANIKKLVRGTKSEAAVPLSMGVGEPFWYKAKALDAVLVAIHCPVPSLFDGSLVPSFTAQKALTEPSLV